MALDYGMALARGLVAPQKELQAEVKKLASGTFKTEEWWNKQLDRQIKEGYKETARVDAGFFSGRGTLASKIKRKGFESATPVYGMVLQPRRRGSSARMVEKLIGYDTVKQKDLSSDELKSIEAQSKEETKKAKRAAGQRKGGKRMARGASGLVGRSERKDQGIAADLPSLGSTGLGFQKTYLG